MADRIRAIQIITNYKRHLRHTTPDLISPVRVLFQFLRSFATGSCTTGQPSKPSRLCYSATRLPIFKKSSYSQIPSKNVPLASRSLCSCGMLDFLSISRESYRRYSFQWRRLMASPNEDVHFFCRTNSLDNTTSSVSFSSRPVVPLAEQPGKLQMLSLNTGSGLQPETVSFPNVRCSEKGCVFPVAPPPADKCAYHRRQQEEPFLFSSHQPSHLLLDPARSMPSEEEYDGDRERDRRRLAALWEQFQDDDAA